MYYGLKSSREISRVNVELQTNVSEVSSVSIIRVHVANHRMSLIFIPVCQIDASSNRYKYQWHMVIRYIDPEAGGRVDSMKCWFLVQHWHGWSPEKIFGSFIRSKSFKSYIMYYLYVVLLCLSFLASLACIHSYHVMSEVKTDEFFYEACLVWLCKKRARGSQLHKARICQSAESCIWEASCVQTSASFFICLLVYLFIHGLLSDAVSSSERQITRWLMHELERMWKEAIVS
jgi:hypothetical protein